MAWWWCCVVGVGFRLGRVAMVCASRDVFVR